jgi:hypothetical protein
MEHDCKGRPLQKAHTSKGNKEYPISKGWVFNFNSAKALRAR